MHARSKRSSGGSGEKKGEAGRRERRGSIVRGQAPLFPRRRRVPAPVSSPLPLAGTKVQTPVRDAGVRVARGLDPEQVLRRQLYMLLPWNSDGICI